MGEAESLKNKIMTQLKTVIDPETGADVIRMRLVEDITVDEYGHVQYTFRPSSPLCPLATFLIQQIKQTVSEVIGVTSQQIKVAGYIASDELTTLINKET